MIPPSAGLIGSNQLLSFDIASGPILRAFWLMVGLNDRLWRIIHLALLYLNVRLLHSDQSL
jgi:hypothetical protein